MEEDILEEAQTIIAYCEVRLTKQRLMIESCRQRHMKDYQGGNDACQKDIDLAVEVLTLLEASLRAARQRLACRRDD